MWWEGGGEGCLERVMGRRSRRMFGPTCAVGGEGGRVLVWVLGP